MVYFLKKKHILAQAPMDGYTDCAFREVVKKYGNPDLLFTEFVNVQGLVRAPIRLFDILRYEETQRPIIAQLFGKEPEYFYTAARIVCELGYDGIDINMGCPAKNVAGKGGGAALIKAPKLARQIIAAVKEGREDYKACKPYTINPELQELIHEKLKEWGVKVEPKRDITMYPYMYPRV